GASAGDGALAGGAAGDAGGVSARGIAGGSGAPGDGALRTSGIGGAGNGEGVRAGARGGVAGLAAGEGVSGRAGGGPGNGPGGGDGGPVASRGSGVGAGSGANAAGEFGVRNSAGSGADVNSKGSGAAGSGSRADIKIAAAGGGGADIQTTRIGSRENSNNNGPVQVRSGNDKKARVGSAPQAGDGLSKTIDPQGFDAIINAKRLSGKKPELTEEMKASSPKSATVEFTIGPNGSSSYKIVSSSGNPDVDAAVLRACASYRWQAATKGGKPVESKQRIVFNPND
ncbi:MAG: TonB family protein, partial [Akkermansiaceae bacterium]|nr:TonB family protein [Armatimonadota bacterium]